MDVTNTTSQEIYTKVCNLLALIRISKFAVGGYAILGTTNATNFSFNRNTLGMSKLYDLLGTRQVNVKGLLMGAIVHNGRKASSNALQRLLIGTMIKVQSNRNGNVLVLNQLMNH